MMKFKVKFTSGNSFLRRGPFPINIKSGFIGLGFLKMIRDECGVPDLDLDLVEEEISYFKDTPRVNLSEDQAVAAGEIFNDTNFVSVCVPNKYLNKYTFPKVYFEKDPVDGRVTKAGIKWAFDGEACVEDWLAAGAPLTWGVKDKEELEHFEFEEEE